MVLSSFDYTLSESRIVDRPHSVIDYPSENSSSTVMTWPQQDVSLLNVDIDINNVGEYDFQKDLKNSEYILITHDSVDGASRYSYILSNTAPIYEEREVNNREGLFDIIVLNNATLYDVVEHEGSYDIDFYQNEYSSLPVLGTSIVGSNFDFTEGTKYLVDYTHSNFQYPYTVHSSTDIEFDMTATQVNVTVPLNISCNINPNIDNGFQHGDAIIVNNTYAPVKLYVSLFDDTSNELSMIKPDGLAQGLSWNTLTKDLSKKFLSIGLKPSDTGWLQPSDEYCYAGVINSKVPLGVLAGKSSSNLLMTANYGRSFEKASNVNLRIGFVAELCIN